MTLYKTAQETKDKIIGIKEWTFLLFICLRPLSTFFSSFLGSSYVHIILIALIYLPFLYLFFIKKEPIYAKYLLLLAFLFFVFAIYGLIYADKHILTKPYALSTTISLSGGIIGFFICSIQDNPRKLWNALRITTVIWFIYIVYLSINILSSPTYMDTYGYDMAFGYFALLPCLLSLNFATGVKLLDIKKIERIFWAIIFVYCTILIFLYGSRGPIVSIIAFLMLKFLVGFLKYSNKSIRTKLAVILISVCVLAAFILFFDSLVQALVNILSQFGYTSRTLSRILSHTVTFDNGRTGIMHKYLAESNLIGYGPFADQYKYGAGNYCHNLFVELIYDFGIIIGVFLIALIIYRIIRILGCRQYLQWSEVYIVFLGFCTGRLMLSGTFWSETYFWMTLGLGFLCIKEMRKNGYFADSTLLRSGF